MGFFNDLKEDLSQAVDELGVSGKAEEKEVEEETVNEAVEAAPEVSVPDVEEEAPKAPVAQGKTSDEIALITEGMEINGNISSTGSMDLLGSIKGNITISGKLNILGTVEGDSKAAEIYAEAARVTGEVNSLGSVKIGQDSVVIGNIFATSAVIAGAVKGDIDVKGPVILDTTAIVMGNIKSKSVQINNGAVVEGICSQCYADVSPTTFFEDKFKKSKK